MLKKDTQPINSVKKELEYESTFELYCFEKRKQFNDAKLEISNFHLEFVINWVLKKSSEKKSISMENIE